MRNGKKDCYKREVFEKADLLMKQGMERADQGKKTCVRSQEVTENWRVTKN